MIQDAFSSRLLRQIETARPGTVLDAIAKNCAELGVAALFVLRKNPIIWLVGENENLEEKRERLKCWLRFLEVEPAGIHIYPLPFADPYINNLPEVRKIEWKGELLQDIFRQRRVLVLSTLAALNIPLERDLELADIGCPIRKDTPIGRDAFIARAKDLGYLPRPVVEDKGDIAWRGNLVDLFAVNSDAPLRLEFEGERIVSLRQFDLSSQRSIGPVNDFFISANRFFYSAGQEPHPWIHSGKRTAYLNEALADPLLVVSNLIKLNGEHEKLLLHFQKIFDSLSDERSAWPAPATLFPRTPSAGAVIRLEDFPLDPQRGQEIVGLPYSISTLNATDLAAIQERLSRGYRLYLFSSETQIADNLKSLLPVQGHHAFSLPLSFENLERQTLFLTDRRFVFREKRELFREINVEKWIQEIRPGERVVHRVHGIGCFSAFQRLSFEGETVEFLKIEYQNQEYLYVPVYDLDALTRYVAPEGALPKLDRLGGKTWRFKTAQARRSIVHFARELLELYALRRAIKKQPNLAVAELEEKLEREFIYVETEDQKNAIRQVLADLENDYPMDRLLCGDVSFGKTEVAIRAALRAVANQRQVAFLCPTTILAFQHYQTFQRRLKDFPVHVAMLSRMVAPKERVRIMGNTKQGKVDILIGTHALLSRSVDFKNLGLYIVDEEQRFGVFQKEKLKKSREHIDVLTLSATPIPRTLSLSLAGLQDISLIRTPPIGRLAVKNYIGYFSRQVIVSAVLNEIERDGAVFIVYNNIERLYAFQEKIRAWLPDIPLAVLHAKLKTAAIERNLLDFIAKKYRILLSTTIIENGIDIPAVNTLILIDADRFGLTQLYQLRGRIGRSSQQAYAYFLLDPERGDIGEQAQKRLEAIRDFCQLGAGYKIAEFDLLLRGAGSLLGNRQHGHVEALGFDYYLQLLQQSVDALKGNASESLSVELRVHFAYAIADTYIEETAERMRIYQEIAAAQAPADLLRLKEEMEDRFGRMPESMEKALGVGAVKLFARLYRWPKAEVFSDRVCVQASQPPRRDAGPLLRRLQVRWEEPQTLVLPFGALDDFIRLGQRLGEAL